MSRLFEMLGRNAISGPARHGVGRWLARPFDAWATTRCLIVYEPNRISFSQVHPFLQATPALRARGVSLRLVARPRLEAAAAGLRGVDVALFQTWFDADADQIAATLDRLRGLGDAPEISYLDSFAANDLRLARHLDDHIRFYLKKALFRDRTAYLRPRRGDTNLTEHYGDLYGVAGQPVDWQAPPAMLGRLRLTPTFFTAPGLIGRFLRDPLPAPQRTRRIDLHARLATDGAPWYRRMREDALARATTVPGLRTISGAGVPWRRYIRELGASRLCLSPFGYGELCWRDMEAFLCGSVVIKQDMGHLETAPDLYRPNETYLPVRWDFSDLAERIAEALDDPDRCDAIAAAARGAVRDYLTGDGFMKQMEFLFEPESARVAAPLITGLSQGGAGLSPRGRP